MAIDLLPVSSPQYPIIGRERTQIQGREVDNAAAVPLSTEDNARFTEQTYQQNRDRNVLFKSLLKALDFMNSMAEDSRNSTESTFLRRRMVKAYEQNASVTEPGRKGIVDLYV